MRIDLDPNPGVIAQKPHGHNVPQIVSIDPPHGPWSGIVVLSHERDLALVGTDIRETPIPQEEIPPPPGDVHPDPFGLATHWRPASVCEAQEDLTRSLEAPGARLMPPADVPDYIAYGTLIKARELAGAGVRRMLLQDGVIWTSDPAWTSGLVEQQAAPAGPRPRTRGQGLWL